MQKTLSKFVNPVYEAPQPEMVSHREIILYLLQLGVVYTEKNLFRAVKNEIWVLRAKNRQVAAITPQALRRQLCQLARENLVEQIGFCWQLRG